MASPARSLANPPVRQLRTHHDHPLTAGQVARTLEDLIQLGFIEAYRDEHNVVRFRPLVAARQKV